MNAITQQWPVSRRTHVAPTSRRRPKLFRGLTAPQMTLVRRAFTEELFHDGEPVPREEPLVGFVLQGALREDIADADGSDRLFGMSFAGEILSPVGRRTGNAQLTALGETTVVFCEAGAFDALLHEIPRLRMNYLNALQDRIAEARRWQVMLGRKTAMERVATMLFCFWERQGRPNTMSLRLRRAEIGQLLCLTFETVSRQIKALEQAGVIELPQPSCVRLRDPQHLYVASGEASVLRRAA